MAYEVLARKWRPQQFSDVVGQDHVVQTLTNAIEGGRLAHAYLFVGPRGVGKTSIARILSKAMNCAGGPTATPCGKCDSCVEITAGTNLDVMEIDGASNNGVEQVRELRETVKYAPVRGPSKVYIIDEVHMLSAAAFNALLKTLEEPPAHVKFMFATTEPEKVLATIVSRCQRFDLRRIPVRLIVERLKEVAKDEKVKVDDDALLAIARGAEGGMRDAESAMDQLISFKGKKIKEEDVLSVFGLVSRVTLEDLGAKVLEGDIGGLVKTVADLDENGKNLQRLVLEIMEHFRNLLVCQHVEDPETGMDLTDGQVEVLRKQAQLADTDRILRITDILGETEERMRYALSKRTLLETALIRCARAANVVSLNEVLLLINELKAGGNLPAPRRDGSVREGGREVYEAKRPTGAKKEMRVAATPEQDLQTLQEQWKDIIEKVGRISVRARQGLADAQPLAVDADRVVIAFDPEFVVGMEQFEHVRNRRAVEHVLAAVLQRDVTAEFKKGESRLSAPEPDEEEDVSAELPDPDPPPVTASDGPPGEPPPGRRNTDRRRWVKDPAVAKTMELFNGSIVDVRE